MKHLGINFLLFLIILVICVSFFGIFTFLYHIDGSPGIKDLLRVVFPVSLLFAVSVFIFRIKELQKGHFIQFCVFFFATVLFLFSGVRLLHSPEQKSKQPETVTELSVEESSVSSAGTDLKSVELKQKKLFSLPQSFRTFTDDVGLVSSKLDSYSTSSGQAYLLLCIVLSLYTVSALFFSDISVWDGFNVLLCLLLFRGLFLFYRFFSDETFREIGYAVSKPVGDFFPEIMLSIIGALLFLIFIFKITGRRAKTTKLKKKGTS